ncbi:MAG TPA: LssY C-terminal domain-containing protein [Stenomitos sp.]
MKRRLLTTLLLLVLAGCARPAAFAPTPEASAPVPQATPTPLPRLSALPSEPFTLADTDKKAPNGDAVNLVLVGSQAAVKGAIAKAGWLVADPITTATSLRMARTSLLDLPYPTGPMSRLYLFGREQDAGYQIPTDTVRKRDHFRIWRTPVRDPAGRETWAVAATKDVGIRVVGGPTHVIAPKIDEERALVAQTLTSTSWILDSYQVPAVGHPYQAKNGGGDPYESDGMAQVLVISETASAYKPEPQKVAEAP